MNTAPTLDDRAPYPSVLPLNTFIGWMSKLKGFERNKDRNGWTSWNASSGVGAPLAVNRIQPWGSSTAYIVSAADPGSGGWWEAPNARGWHAPVAGARAAYTPTAGTR